MDDRPVLVIADFRIYGGAKNAFKMILEYFLTKSLPIHVWLLRESVLTEEDSEWLCQNNVKVGFLPNRISSPSSWVKKFRLAAVVQYLYFRRFKDSFSKVYGSIERPYSMIVGAAVWRERFFYCQYTYPQGKPSLLTFLVTPLRRLYFRFLAKKRYTFIAGSRGGKMKFQNQLGLLDFHLPIKVIPFPVKTGFSNSLIGESKQVFTMGHVEKHKGPDFWLTVAILACQMDSEISFIWGGKGSQMDRIRAMVPSQYQDRIKLAGFIDDVEQQFINTAIYFQPSLVENQGLAVLEAMSNSIPCIVSKIGGLPELVDDNDSGYVIDFDAESCAQKMIDLIQDPEVRSKMGKKGKQKYQEGFTHEIWEERMDQLLFSA